MIPREILKKIRQIELRTNRVVTETFAGASLQPAAQFRRIPRAVPDSADYNFRSFPFDGEINRIWPRFWEFGLSGQSAGKGKPLWIFANDSEKNTQLAGKSLAQ